MTHNFNFLYSLFRTQLSYQYLANRETELWSGDLRFHGRASSRIKGKKRNYTDCIGKKTPQKKTKKQKTKNKNKNYYPLKHVIEQNITILLNQSKYRKLTWSIINCFYTIQIKRSFFMLYTRFCSYHTRNFTIRICVCAWIINNGRWNIRF